MSWRGRPVHAQIRCLTRTLRSWCPRLPSLNEGSRLVTAVSQVSFLASTSLASISVARPLVFDAIMNFVSPSTLAGLPSSRTPKPSANTTLPPWTSPTATPGTPVSFCASSTNFASTASARRVERVGLLARERLALAALRQQLAEHQPELRAPLLGHAVGDVDDRHGPHAVGPAHVDAEAALLVRRDLVLVAPAVGPPVAVGGRRLDLERRCTSSGLYAANAAATAASASFGSGRSTIATHAPPSGASRIVAGPRTDSDQPTGAMNVLPAVVVRGASAVNFSAGVLAGSSGRATGGLSPAFGFAGGVSGSDEEHAATRSRAARARIARDLITAPASPTDPRRAKNHPVTVKPRRPPRSRRRSWRARPVEESPGHRETSAASSISAPTVANSSPPILSPTLTTARYGSSSPPRQKPSSQRAQVAAAPAA
jgi:hypothetical protein